MEKYKECVICGNIIPKSNKTNKHHFPKLKCNGGETTINLCVSCHTMIHKTPIKEFPAECLSSFLDIFDEYDEYLRWHKLIIAKFFAQIQEAERLIEEAEHEN